MCTHLRSPKGSTTSGTELIKDKLSLLTISLTFLTHVFVISATEYILSTSVFCEVICCQKLMAATRTFDFNGNPANSALNAAFVALQCIPRFFLNFHMKIFKWISILKFISQTQKLTTIQNHRNNQSIKKFFSNTLHETSNPIDFFLFLKKSFPALFH